MRRLAYLVVLLSLLVTACSSGQSHQTIKVTAADKAATTLTNWPT